MDLKWGTPESTQFITNVGLISTNGPYGDNIMACEWTHQVSYSPGMIAVAIGKNKTSEENISASKVFGVSLCSEEQNVMASIAGGSSGKEINKMEALKELGYSFFKGDKTGVLLVKSAALQVECKLKKKIKTGDHTLFIGEVVAIYPLEGAKPLAYHKTSYWRLGEKIAKPEKSEIDRIDAIVKKHKKQV